MGTTRKRAPGWWKVRGFCIALVGVVSLSALLAERVILGYSPSVPPDALYVMWAVLSLAVYLLGLSTFHPGRDTPISGREWLAVPAIVSVPWLFPWILISVVIGACLVVWGGSIARRSRGRSVTPRGAILAPLLASAAFGAPFTLARVGFDSYAYGPLPPVRAVTTVFRSLPGLFVAGTCFLVVGAAVRRRDGRYAALGSVLALAVTAAIPRAGLLTDFVPMLVSVLVYGTVPFLIGYATAAPAGTRVRNSSRSAAVE